MNKLNVTRRAAILRALCDGCSVSATARMTGASKVTILRLLEAVGPVALDYQRKTLTNLPTVRVQADEQWSYIFSKDKNTPLELRGTGVRGDCWTWIGLDADSKLVITWHVGRRDSVSAGAFMLDLAARLANRVQLTTDAFHPYLDAVEAAFGADVDYARLIKVFGLTNVREASRRYSPAHLVRSSVEVVTGDPAPEHVSTSFIERNNLTMRMNNRRFTRLTNGFSKKLANHKHSIALQFFYYNFCRKHMTLTADRGGLHTTPAMAAGQTDRVWTLENLVEMVDASEK